MKRARKGFSLLETAIILSVAGAILGGLWATIGVVREKNRQSQLVVDVSSVVQNVRDFFRNSATIADPSGLMDEKKLTHYAIMRGLLPPEMLRARALSGGVYLADHSVADANWIASNGTTGSFSLYSESGTADYQFMLVLRGLRKAPCIALVPKLTAAAQGAVTPLSSKINSSSYTRPLSPDEANSLCSSSEGNMITLTFRLRENM